MKSKTKKTMPVLTRQRERKMKGLPRTRTQDALAPSKSGAVNASHEVTCAPYRKPCGAKPCSECPFLRTSPPGWLGAATPQSFIVEISYENPLPCHPTINYDDPDWLEKWGRQEIGSVCQGSLVMAANMCKIPRDPASARAKPDRDLVFSTHLEFIAHHESADVRSWETAERFELRTTHSSDQG